MNEWLANVRLVSIVASGHNGIELLKPNQYKWYMYIAIDVQVICAYTCAYTSDIIHVQAAVKFVYDTNYYGHVFYN